MSKKKALAQTSDDSFIKNIVEEVIKNNPAVVEDFKSGRRKRPTIPRRAGDEEVVQR